MGINKLNKKEEVIQYVKSQILGQEKKWSNFNGIIGGKNREYGVNMLDYDTPDDYIAAWMQGHKRIYEVEKHFPK